MWMTANIQYNEPQNPEVKLSKNPDMNFQYFNSHTKLL